MNKKTEWLIDSEKFDLRNNAHLKLVELLEFGGTEKEISEHVLDWSYCAWQPREKGPSLASRIKAQKNWEINVSRLTKELSKAKADDVFLILKDYKVPNIDVSVATEIAMLTQPDLHCVVSRRTYFGAQCWKNRQRKNHTDFDSLDVTNMTFGDREGVTGEQHYKRWEILYNEIRISMAESFALYLDQMLKNEQLISNVKFLYADRYWSKRYLQTKKG